jgi:hypothetical protein
MTSEETFILDTFPVPGDAITCGMRKDLFKKKRRHLYVDMGTDTHNKGIEGICDVQVSACIACGKDSRD